MANRMLGDLEFRGHVRPITEEFNLAANYEKSDVCNAEFYRTFGTAVFYGSNLLGRLKAEKQAVGMETRERVRLHFDILKQTI